MRDLLDVEASTAAKKKQHRKAIEARDQLMMAALGYAAKLKQAQQAKKNTAEAWKLRAAAVNAETSMVSQAVKTAECVMRFIG